MPLYLKAPRYRIVEDVVELAVAQPRKISLWDSVANRLQFFSIATGAIVLSCLLVIGHLTKSPSKTKNKFLVSSHRK